MNEDLIRRGEVIDALQDWGNHTITDAESWHLRQVIGDIKSLPSVQPEIIRCKDCKHRDKYGCCKYWKGLAMADIPIATDDNDFCSYAERI